MRRQNPVLTTSQAVVVAVGYMTWNQEKTTRLYTILGAKKPPPNEYEILRLQHSLAAQRPVWTSKATYIGICTLCQPRLL